MRRRRPRSHKTMAVDVTPPSRPRTPHSVDVMLMAPHDGSTSSQSFTESTGGGSEASDVASPFTLPPLSPLDQTLPTIALDTNRVLDLWDNDAMAVPWVTRVHGPPSHGARGWSAAGSQTVGGFLQPHSTR